MHANASKCINLGTVQTLTAQAGGTVVSPTIDMQQSKGCLIFINVTSITGSLTVTLQGVGPTGTAYTILASAAISATGQTVLKVYPGLTASANAVANDVTPITAQLSSVVATGPCTATISMQLIY
jgi:hypothetical protein